MSAVKDFIASIKNEPVHEQRDSVTFLSLYAKYSAAKFKMHKNEQANLSRLIEFCTNLKYRFDDDDKLASVFIEEITKIRNGSRARAESSKSKADWHMFYKTDEAVRWLADFLSQESK